MVPLRAGLHHLKLYNDWYMMVHKVTGLELYGELKRAALKCDCKMFYHQLQCLHVWLVMHVKGHMDLAAVCEALPRRTKVSNERLSLAPLFAKSLCAKCDAQVSAAAKKGKGKGKRDEFAASKARALKKALAAAAKKKKGKHVAGGGGGGRQDREHVRGEGRGGGACGEANGRRGRRRREEEA